MSSGFNKFVTNYKKLPTWAQIAIPVVGSFLLYKGVKKLVNPPTGKTKNIYLTGGEGIPQTGIDDKGDPVYWSPSELAGRLHETMDGWTDSTSSKEAAWGDLATLATDDMVVAVYEYFNQMWGKDYAGYETLTKWIESEWGDIVGMNKESALARLRKLGLNDGGTISIDEFISSL